MSAERAILVTCDGCRVEQVVTQKETVVVPTIHTARLYLSMQGWSKRGNVDLCYKTECVRPMTPAGIPLMDTNGVQRLY